MYPQWPISSGNSGPFHSEGYKSLQLFVFGKWHWTETFSKNCVHALCKLFITHEKFMAYSCIKHGSVVEIFLLRQCFYSELAGHGLLMQFCFLKILNFINILFSVILWTWVKYYLVNLKQKIGKFCFHIWKFNLSLFEATCLSF